MLIKLLQLPHFKSERGAAALSFSLFVAAAGAFMVSQVTSDSQNAVSMTKKQVMKANLKSANEEALNLASHLIGNGVVGVTDKNEGKLEFTSDTQKRSKVIANKHMNTADGIRLNTQVVKGEFTAKQGGNWEINDGKLVVFGCIVGRLNSDTAEKVFKKSSNDEGFEWAAARGRCTSTGRTFGVETRITLTKTVPQISTVRSGYPLTHVQVRAQSESNGERLATSAVLKLPSASNQCDRVYIEKSGDISSTFGGKAGDLKACKVDHCPFMQPVTVEGAVQYKPDGSPYLMPNPNYLDNISGQINIHKYNVEKGIEGDGEEVKPEELYKFYSGALEPGLKNPFYEKQRIGGNFNNSFTAEVNNIDPESGIADVTVKMVHSNRISPPKGSNDNFGFEGWLVHEHPSGGVDKDGKHIPGVTGSTALPVWPQGVGFDDEAVRKYLRNGCKRSLVKSDEYIDSNLIDFCARIRYPLFKADYNYEEGFRTCKYYGPNPNDPRLAAEGFNPVRNLYLNSNALRWDTQTRADSTLVELPAQKLEIDIDKINLQPDAKALLKLQANNLIIGFEYVTQDIVTMEGQKRIYEDSIDSWHDELGGDGLSLIKVPFKYNGGYHVVNFGTQSPKKIFLPLVYEGADLFSKYKLVSYDIASNKMVYTWTRVILTWTPECNIESEQVASTGTSLKNFSHEQNLCFYVTYHNAADRLNCSREISYVACRNGNGCFAGDTEITMADGTKKNIQNIQEGELVLNPTTGKKMAVSVQFVGDELKPLYRFNFHSPVASLTVTENHPMVIEGGIVVRADQVKKTDKILSDGGEFLTIRSIELKTNDVAVPVWNLLLANIDRSPNQNFEDHFLIANGVVTGDWYIQNNRFPKHEYSDFSEFLSRRLLQHTQHPR